MGGVCTLREHDAFDDSLLSKAELRTLVANNVLKYRDSDLATNNYVGVFTTQRRPGSGNPSEDRSRQ